MSKKMLNWTVQLNEFLALAGLLNHLFLVCQGWWIKKVAIFYPEIVRKQTIAWVVIGNISAHLSRVWSKPNHTCVEKKCMPVRNKARGMSPASKVNVTASFAPKQYHAAYFIMHRKAKGQLSCFLTNITGIVKQQIDSHIKDPDQQSNGLC